MAPQITEEFKFANTKLRLILAVMSKTFVSIFLSFDIIMIMWILILGCIYIVWNNGLLIFMTQL